MLGGIVPAQVASEGKWRMRAEALEARVIELETTAAVRVVHMQEETAPALAWEREFWQRYREA